MDLTAETAAAVLRVGIIAWLGIMAVVVFYQVLIKDHAFREMLTGQRFGRGAISPERLGEFGIVVMVAGYYILTSDGAVQNAETGAYWMPDIPESLLIILAGGKSMFLAGKIARRPNP